MKIIAFGDLHGFHDQIKIPTGIDLLICTGDITEHGSEQEMNLFIKWLKKQNCDYKIVIAGNHDHCLEQNERKWNTEFAKNGITYLCNQMVDIEGIKIYGSPFIPESGNWSFQKKTTQELKANWNLIPTNCDILVTHGPPHGILDTHRGNHIGDIELYRGCQRIMPKYHFFGHVHGCHGALESTLTTYINCAYKKLLNKKQYTPPIWQVNP